MYRALNPGAIGVKAGFLRAVELASKFGFEGIYFNPTEVAEIGAAKADTILGNHYLKAAGFSLPVNYRKTDAELQESIARLPALAEVAAKIGCLRCSTFIAPGSNELPFKENFDLLRRRLGEAAKILARYKIRLALEFIGPKTSRVRFKHEFIYNAGGMLDLCKAIGTGNVGLLLDCWHWYTSGGTPKDFDRWSKENIVDVHVNDAPAGIPVDQQIDNIRRLPGETGVIDIKSFLRGLKKIGYDGPVMVEPFSERLRKMKEEDALQTTRESLDKIWRIAGLT